MAIVKYKFPSKPPFFMMNSLSSYPRPKKILTCPATKPKEIFFSKTTMINILTKPSKPKLTLLRMSESTYTQTICKSTPKTNPTFTTTLIPYITLQVSCVQTFYFIVLIFTKLSQTLTHLFLYLKLLSNVVIQMSTLLN